MIVIGGLLGLIILVSSVALFFVIRKRRHEKARADAWNKSQTWDGTLSAVTQERLLDRWVPRENALGLLVVLQSDDPAMIGLHFEITKPETRLGRSADNDVVFAKDGPVSRFHAVIEARDGKLFLREAVSRDENGNPKLPTFGTFLNIFKIGAQPVLLRHHDKIRLGKRAVMCFKAVIRQPGSKDQTVDGFAASSGESGETRRA
jgi:hypothetical protein